jgi:hypothetical protein
VGALPANGCSTSAGGVLNCGAVTLDQTGASTPKIMQADGYVADSGYFAQLQMMDGTPHGPSLGWPSAPGTGIYHAWDAPGGTDYLQFTIDGASNLQIRPNALTLLTTQPLRWSADTCMSRDGAAGIVRLGCLNSTAHVLRLYYDATHYLQIQPDSSGKMLSLNLRDAGQCTMTAGACSAQTLGHTYTAAPGCVLTWTGTGTLTGHLMAPSTTTTVTPASDVNTDTAQVTWACFGN